ncbi:MAG: carboxypeptidase regulatory-like domain-containing protein [Planctomycetota bacterium]
MQRYRLILALVAATAALALWLWLRDGRDPAPQQPPVEQRQQQPAPEPEPEQALERTAAPAPKPQGPAAAGPAGPGRRDRSDAPGLHGVVKQTQGSGVAGILIELVDADGNTVLSTVSGEKGRFAFDEVAPAARSLTTRVAPNGLPRLRHEGWKVSGNQRMILWVPPSDRITGTVVDADGRPVAGVQVHTDKPYMPMGMRPWRVIEGEMPPATFQVETDASGRFELPAALPGTHRLRANHRGVTGSVRARSDERGVVLRLGTHLGGSVTFSGQLTDRRTGDPIAKARLQVMRVKRSAGGYSATGVANAITDAQGRYEVQGLDVGRFSFSATPDGYARHSVAERDYQAGAHIVDLTLIPARSLRVQVVLPDGSPAKGAKVRARDGDGRAVEMPGRLRMMGKEVAVDARGIAELRRLPAAPVTLTAVRGDFVPAGSVEVDLTAAAPELVTIRMPSTTTRFARNHFFRLHGPDGAPADIDGTVVASAFDGERLVSRVEGRWSGDKFVLGNHAQYDFSRPTLAVGAPATACRIEIVAPGYQPVTLTLEPGAKSPTLVELHR